MIFFFEKYVIMYKIDGGRFKNHSLGQTLAFFKGSVLETIFGPLPLFSYQFCTWISFFSHGFMANFLFMLP